MRKILLLFGIILSGFYSLAGGESWEYIEGNDVTVTDNSFEMIGAGEVSKIFDLDFSSTPLISFNLTTSGSVQWNVRLCNSSGGELKSVNAPVVHNGIFDLDVRAVMGWSGQKVVKVIFEVTNGGTLTVQEIEIKYYTDDALYPPNNTGVISFLGPDAMGFKWSHVKEANEYTIEYWMDSSPGSVYSITTGPCCTVKPTSRLSPGIWRWRIKAMNGLDLVSTSHTWSFRQGDWPAEPVTFSPVHLTVSNTTTFRRNEIVSSGVPFKKGQFWPSGNIELIDSNQVSIPAQHNPLCFWDDGSIKWSLITFPAQVEPTSSAAFVLQPSADVPNSTDNIIGINGQTFVIDTGSLELIIPFDGLAPFGDCQLSNGPQLEFPMQISVGAILGAEPTDPVTNFTASSDAETWIEENGPIRAVVVTDGTLKDPNDNIGFDYIARFIFSKNHSDVKMSLTLVCKTGTIVRGGLVTTVLLDHITVSLGNINATTCSFGQSEDMTFTLGNDKLILDQNKSSEFTIIRE